MQHPAWLLAWLPFLVGMQGVAHSGGLRTMALLAGLLHVTWLSRTSQSSLPAPTHDRSVVVLFFLLLFWLVFHTAVLAPLTVTSFIALADDWGKLLLMVGLGLSLARSICQSNWIFIGLFVGAFLHVPAVLSFQAFTLIGSLETTLQASWLSEYPLASYYCVTAIVWLVVDVIARYSWNNPLFPWSLTTSVLLLGLALLAEILLPAKSGHVMLLCIGMTVVFAIFTIPGKKRIRCFAPVVALFIALSTTMWYFNGSRWFGLFESLYAAQPNEAPLVVYITDDAPIPENANHSFYLRAVRGGQAITGIITNPLGLGYGPDVFQRLVKERLGVDHGILSSNSGLIDFTLATGIPGLALLLLLCFALIRSGWSSFRQGRMTGLILVLLVIHQLGRYALDGTLGGSRLTGPTLAIAALWVLSRVEQKRLNT